MAEMTISLRRDPETGKQIVTIGLRSDADALPHEHEQQHRSLVERLIGKDNIARVVVEREQSKEPAAPTGNQPEAERQAAGQGGT
jgi:hypothetical protein